MIKVFCVIFFETSFRKSLGLTLFSLFTLEGVSHRKSHDFSKDFCTFSTLHYGVCGNMHVHHWVYYTSGTHT